ncbi:hypothetical protein GGF31_000410 [Allomyces arbusculus]|nr:hypothetical protein GGF31_000410 [Allomyces arbusculus]
MAMGEHSLAVETEFAPVPLVQRHGIIESDAEPTAALGSSAGSRTGSPNAHADATTSTRTNGHGELPQLLFPASTPASPPRTPKPSDPTLDKVPYKDRNLVIVLFLAVYLDQARNPNRAIYQQSYPLPLSDEDVTTITTQLIHVLTASAELDHTIRVYSSLCGDGIRVAPLARGLGDNPPRSLEKVRIILADVFSSNLDSDTNGIVHTEPLVVHNLHADSRIARRVRGYVDLASRLVLSRNELQFGVSTAAAPVDCPVRSLPVVLVEASDADAHTACRWTNFVSNADAVVAARWFYLDLDRVHIVDGNALPIDRMPTESREEEGPAAVPDQSVPPEPDLPAPLAELTWIDGNLCIVLFVAVYCDMRSNPTRPIYQQALSLPLSDQAVTDLTDVLLDILTTGSGLDRNLRSFAASSTPVRHLPPSLLNHARNTMVHCAQHPRKMRPKELATLARNNPHRVQKVIERIRAYLTIWVPAMLAAEGRCGLPFAAPGPRSTLEPPNNVIPCIFELAAGADRASSHPLPLQWAVTKPDATAAAQFLFPDLSREFPPHPESRSASRIVGVDGDTEMDGNMPPSGGSGPDRSRGRLDNFTVLDGNFCIVLFVAVYVDRLHHPERAIYEKSFSLPISSEHVTELVGVFVHERRLIQNRVKVPVLHRSPVVLAKIRQYLTTWVPALLDDGGLPFCSTPSSSTATGPPFSAIPCIFTDAGGASADAAEHRSVRWATMTDDVLSAARFLCPGLDGEIAIMPDADSGVLDSTASLLVPLPPPLLPPVLSDLTTVDGNVCIALFVATHMNRLLCPDHPIFRECYTLPLTDDTVAKLTKVLMHALTTGAGLGRVLRTFQGLKPNTSDPDSTVIVQTLSKRVSARNALVDCIVVHEATPIDRSARLRISSDDVRASPAIAEQTRRYLTEWLPALLESGGLPFSVPGSNAFGTIFPVFDRVSDDGGQVSIQWAQATAERSDAVRLLNLKYDEETKHAQLPVLSTLSTPELPAVLQDLRPIDGNLCTALFVAVTCDARMHPDRAIYQQSYPLPMSADVAATVTEALLGTLTAGAGMKRTIRAFPMRRTGQDLDSLRATAEIPQSSKIVRLLLAQLARPALRTYKLAEVPNPHRSPTVADHIRRYLVEWTPALITAGGLPFRAKAGKTSIESSICAVPCVFDTAVDEASGDRVLKWAVEAPHKLAAARYLYPEFDKELEKYAVADLDGGDTPDDDKLGLTTVNCNVCIALFVAAAFDDQGQNPGARPIDYDEFPVPLDAAHVASLADRLVKLLGTRLNSRITAFAKTAAAAPVLAVRGMLQKRRTVREVLNELVEHMAGSAAVSKAPHAHAAVRDRIKQYLTSWVPGLAERDGATGFPIPAGVVDVDAIPSVLEVVFKGDGQRVMRWTDLAALDCAVVAAFCHELASGDDDHGDHDDVHEDDASPAPRNAARTPAQHAVDEHAGSTSRCAARTPVRHPPATSAPADDRLLAAPWTLANFAMLAWSAISDDLRSDPDRVIYRTSFSATTDEDDADHHDLVVHLIQCCTSPAAKLVLQAPPPSAAHTDLVPMTVPDAQNLATNPAHKQGRLKQVALDKLVGAYLRATFDAVRCGQAWTTPAGQVVPCVLARDPDAPDAKMVWNPQLTAVEAPVSFWAPDGAEPKGHAQVRQMGKVMKSARTPIPAAAVGRTTSTPTPTTDALMAANIPEVPQALANQCHVQLCALIDRLTSHMLATLHLPANSYNTAAILAAWETHVKVAADIESLVLVHDSTINHLAQFLAASLASQLATEFATHIGGAPSARDALSICHEVYDVQQSVKELAGDPGTELVYLSDLYDNTAPWAQAMHAALDAMWEMFRTVNVHRAPGMAVDLVRDAVLDMVVVCATLARVGVRVEFPPVGSAVNAARMVTVGPPMFTVAASDDDMDEDRVEDGIAPHPPLFVVAAVAPWLIRTDDGTHVVPHRAEVLCGQSSRTDHAQRHRASAAPMGDSAAWTTPDVPAVVLVEWTATIGSRAARTDSPTPARHRLTPVDQASSTPTARLPTKRAASAHECMDCGSITEKGLKVDEETGRAQCHRCRQQERRAQEKHEGATGPEDVEMAETTTSSPLPSPVPMVTCATCRTTSSMWWKSAPHGGLLCTACATGRKTAAPGTGAGAGHGARARNAGHVREVVGLDEDTKSDGGEDEDDTGEDPDGPCGELLDGGEEDDDSDGEYVESNARAPKRRRLSGAPRSR